MGFHGTGRLCVRSSKEADKASGAGDCHDFRFFHFLCKSTSVVYRGIVEYQMNVIYLLHKEKKQCHYLRDDKILYRLWLGF
jgi:hypothetical protein